MMLALGSDDNNLRKAAEAKYQETKANNPMWLFQALVELSGTTQNTLSQQLSLIELRKLLSHENFTFASFTKEAIDHVKQRAMSIIGNTQDAQVRGIAADCIGCICAKLYVEGGPGWDELWPVLMQTMANQSAPPGVRAGCCHVFHELTAETVQRALDKHHRVLAGAFAQCINQPDYNLTVTAIVALVGLLKIAALEDLPQYSLVIPLILQALANTLNSQRYEDARKMGIVLCDLVEAAPEAFRGHTSNLLTGMMGVASEPQVDLQTRAMAIEVMLTYCESEPKTIRKVPNFAQSLFDLLFRYMQHPTFPDDWDNVPVDTEEEELECEDDFELGASSIDRLARSLKAKHVQNIAAATIMANIQSSEWQLRLAAVTAITYITEACCEYFRPQMSLIMDYVTPLLKDENKYIRHSAYMCVCQCCSDFSPKFEQELHAKVIPILVEGLNDVPRTQGMVAEGIATFFEECTLKEDPDEDEKYSKIFADNYAQVLFQGLTALMRNSPQPFVRKSAVEAVGAIAEFCGKNIAQYVDALVPEFQALMTIDENQWPEKDRKNVILAKSTSLQSCTLLAAAVELPAFGKYAGELCDYLTQMLDTQFAPEDPRGTAVYRAWICMGECMKQQLAPYLPAVLKRVFKEASAECDYQYIEDVPGKSIPDAEDGEMHARIWTKDHGEKLVKIKTHAVELKSLSLNCIKCLMETTKSEMGPYVDQIAAIAMDCITFRTSEDVRGEACEIVDMAVDLYKELRPESMNGIVNHLVPRLVELVLEERDHKIIQALWYTMRQVIMAGSVGDLQHTHVDRVAKVLLTFIEDSMKRRNEVLQDIQRTDEDDEEMLTHLADEEYNEDERMEICAEVCGAMLKQCPSFVPIYVEYYLKVIQLLLVPSLTENEQLTGIGLLAKFLESECDQCIAMLNDIAAPMYNYAASPDKPDYIQGGTYCLGLIVQLGPRNPRNFDLQGCATRLYQIVGNYFSSPNVAKTEWLHATANVVHAALKLLETTPQIVDAGALWTSIVNALPISGDEEEAHRVHEKLLRWVVEGNPIVGNQQLSSAIVAKLKTASSNDLNDATREELKKL